MGTRLAKTCVLRAQKTLQDEAGVQWTQGELLDALNDTQLIMVKADPNLYTKVGNFVLVGGPRQNVPSDCFAIKEPIANMGTGAVRGKMIEWQNFNDMTRFDPNWQTKPANAVCRYILKPNEKEKDYYYCYPPSTGNVYIEVNYCAPAPESTINGVNGGNSDSTIPFDDKYFYALYCGIMRRALSKESLGANADLALKYDLLFKESFAMDASGEGKV